MRAPYPIERVEWAYFNWLYSLAVLVNPQASATAVENHLSRIKGTSPRPNDVGVMFFACDDRFMARFGYSLICSCYENAREYGVHVHLYEPSTETLRQLESLRETLPGIDLSYTYEDRVDLGTLPEIGMYYTAFRFLVVKKIIEEARSMIVCLDADSLVRKSPHHAISCARLHDVGLYFRLAKHRLNKNIGAFCVLFNNTPKASRFLDLLCGIAIKFRDRYPRFRSRFYFDQSGLYLSYLLSRLKDRVSFYTVRDYVIDYELSDGSCIWTAKGRRKGDAVFLTEGRRMLQKHGQCAAS